MEIPIKILGHGLAVYDCFGPKVDRHTVDARAPRARLTVDRSIGKLAAGSPNRVALAVGEPEEHVTVRPVSQATTKSDQKDSNFSS